MLDPHNLLAKVHPDLVKVLTLASQLPQPFQVTYGLRTLAAEKLAVETGHSHTMHSRHLADANYSGKCCAVDLTPLVNGVVDFEPPGGVAPTYAAIAAAVAHGASVAGVPIQWGATWAAPSIDPMANRHAAAMYTGFRDWGHIQLPWAKYP